MRVFLFFILLVSFSFASSKQGLLLDNIKALIQKEEHISLAVNKYIIQTGKIPKKSDSTLDWSKLKSKDYLGVNFDTINPYTNKELSVKFNAKNELFINILNDYSYNDEHKFLYNLYSDNKFRLNTIVPKTNSKTDLEIGTQIVYFDTQKNIVDILNSNAIETNPSKKTEIVLPNQTCNTGNYYYALKNEKLTFMYCKSQKESIEIYQNGPIFLTDYRDLSYIKANLGDKAYVKEGMSYFEYYYEGGSRWAQSGTGKTTSSVNDDISMEERILNYIPEAKDLVIRHDGGCMLANGDIFCWGNNKHKKAGIENYGQIDKTLKPDYINTPVMLKVQVDEYGTIKDWYNNPYRVKFEKMATNEKNVCGISPLFAYTSDGKKYKNGGNLYCNGDIHLRYFDSIASDSVKTGSINTSILRKFKKFAENKNDNEKFDNDNAIYLIDIVMVDGTMAVLSDIGDIYTIGLNSKGALGINSNDENLNRTEPQKINGYAGSNIKFKRIFALRDTKTFGALDERNDFYIWGERGFSNITKPTRIGTQKVYEDGIFVNSSEFVLRTYNNKYYATYNNVDLRPLPIDETAIGVSVFNQYYLYVTQDMQLKGSNELLECKTSAFASCDANGKSIFQNAFDELNSFQTGSNNKKYANFSNISIFKSKEIKKRGICEIQDFESGDASGWRTSTDESIKFQSHNTATKFMGLFGNSSTHSEAYGIPISTNGSQTLYNDTKFHFPGYENEKVQVSFRVYKIGNWYTSWLSQGDVNSFTFYINNAKDQSSISNVMENRIGKIKTTGNILVLDQDIGYKDFTGEFQLDGNAKLKLGFGIDIKGGFNKGYPYVSFGIDNIKIESKNACGSSGDVNVGEGETLLYYDDFENKSKEQILSEWTLPPFPDETLDSTNYSTATTYNLLGYPLYDGGDDTGKFLGSFGYLKSNHLPDTGYVNYYGNISRLETIKKEFDFGPSYKNATIDIALDFYGMDHTNKVHWSNDKKLFIYINGNNTISSDYTLGSPFPDKSNNFNIVKDAAKKNNFTYSFKKTMKVKATLDNQGKFTLGFGAEISGTDVKLLTWGVDNIKITTKAVVSSNTEEESVPYMCAMTGLLSASQLYCWGNVGRSLPIVNTNTYDTSKIDSINKLFITQDSEISKQMSFDSFNNAKNMLFLKYPTYIGGFDYPFYFK